MVNPVKVIKGLLEAEEALADFIQNGPSEGIGGYVRDRYRHRCNEFANLPSWAKSLSGITGGSIKRFCTPYWEDNMWDGPASAPPAFPGGQCPVNYRFIWQQRQGSTASGFNWSGNITTTYLGPLSVVDESTGNENCTGPGQSFARQRLVGSGVNQDRLLANGCVDIPPGWRLIEINRVDGGDISECGDIPPDIVPGPNPPPNPGPLPGPEPTDNPDPENPIPFFPIPPFDDPVFGPQPITGPSDDGPPAEPGPPAGGDGLPGDGGAIGGAAGEVNGDEPGQDIDFGPPPEGRIWVGCIVDITVDSRIGSIPGTGPESTVWPSVRGNVALKYSTLFGSSQRINSRYTELFRPNTALTVTGCFLQVQPGGSGLVFPISALTCPENPCEVTNG